MIVSTRLDFGRLVRFFGLPLLVLLAYDTVVTGLFMLGWRRFSVGDLPLPLLGTAIALIVTFRNNAAYEGSPHQLSKLHVERAGWFEA